MFELFWVFVQFLNHPLLGLVGGISVILAAVGFIITGVCWICGITPVIFRLGTALTGRRIAIFGSVENFESLKSTLLESGLFKEKNIILIQKDNIEKAKNETIFLIDWTTFGEQIEQVFAIRKNHQTAVLIYAKPQSIPPKKMEEISDKSNTVIVNSRGRLLNDALTALVTTSYQNE